MHNVPPKPARYPINEHTGKPTRMPVARADDFCATCSFASVCSLAGYGRPELSELHYLVEHIGPFAPGEYVFRRGHPFQALFTVRSGMLKTTTVDVAGHEQIPGFILPGEPLGFDAMHPGRYAYDTVALETTQVCRFSFHNLTTLAAFQPRIQRHLFQTFSKALNSANLVIAGYSSTERVAAFLINLGERYAVRGLSATCFRLSMTHADIASHLHIAAETVSRVLTRFREQGLLIADGTQVQLRDPQRLRDLAHHLLDGQPSRRDAA